MVFEECPTTRLVNKNWKEKIIDNFPVLEDAIDSKFLSLKEYVAERPQKFYNKQVAVLAEYFANGFDRYFFSLKSKYSLLGWAAYDGEILRRVRLNNSNDINDYNGVLEENLLFFVPKIKIPKFVRKLLNIMEVNMFCKFPYFKHKWDGCTCDRCGLRRDDDHKWNGCSCTRCPRKRDKGHKWNCCICKICGKIDDSKLWKKSICFKCGKIHVSIRDVMPKVKRINDIKDIPPLVLETIVKECLNPFLSLSVRPYFLGTIVKLLPKSHRLYKPIIKNLKEYLKNEKKLVNDHDIWAEARKNVRHTKRVLNMENKK